MIVTQGTKSRTSPASAVLPQPRPGPLRRPAPLLRSTRLADLVNTMDPKLVAAAFGMNPEGVMIYLADHVDETRLNG